MTDFEFILAFMAVLLGLAVAEIMSRFADAIAARRTVRIGWLTPLLALTIFMIITQTWVNLWRGRETIVVDGGMMFVWALNAAVFYLAAALVFPRGVAAATSLDDHYWAHKRHVAGILIATAIVLVIGSAASSGGLSLTWRYALSMGLYFAPLLTLLFSRSGRIDIAAMLVLIVVLSAISVMLFGFRLDLAVALGIMDGIG